MEKLKMWDFTLHVNGRWGRNRKDKYDTFDLIDCHYAEEFAADKLAAAVRHKLYEIGYKHGLVSVYRYPVELSGDHKLIEITSGVKVWESAGPF